MTSNCVFVYITALLCVACSLNAIATEPPMSNSALVRNLAPLANVGGLPGVCYSPFHNTEYPINGGWPDINQLRTAIDKDFQLLSRHFTHVRTYYTQHFGIEVAPIAAKYNLKLYLGVFMTHETWWSAEVQGAVNAVTQFPDTVEVLFVGNENLIDFNVLSSEIIDKVNEIKAKLGPYYSRKVLFGTVQRITEYLDPRFDDETKSLAQNLDVLGVNIYPFFTNTYDNSQPTNLLAVMWTAMTVKFPNSKVRLTETGFPTAGDPSSVAPNVRPALDAAVRYYEAMINWTPLGSEGIPRFWFEAFDRRSDDPLQPEYEKHFGFFTATRASKQMNFPRLLSATTSVTTAAPTSSPTIAPTTTAPTYSTSKPPTSTTTTTVPTVIATTGTSTCIIESGVDYVAYDIGNSPSATVLGCCTICNNFRGCRAFSWNRYNGGTCWFKSMKGAKLSLASVTSATIT